MDRSALGFSNEEEGQSVASRHLHSATKSVSSQTPNPIPPRVCKAISGSAFEGEHVLFAAIKKDSQKEYLHWKIMKMPWGEGTGWAGENSAYLVSAHRGDRPFDPQKHREISVRHWPEKSLIFPALIFLFPLSVLNRARKENWGF